MSTKLQREIDQIAFADLLISTWFSHKKTLSFVDISQRLFSQISFTQGEKLPKYLFHLSLLIAAILKIFLPPWATPLTLMIGELGRISELYTWKANSSSKSEAKHGGN